MSIRGIILAAGKASRMGSNKLEAIIDGKTVIESVLSNAEASKLSDIVVVCGKYDTVTKLTKCYNSRYEEGMSTSIITGLGDFNGDGVMIILGDMPFISAETIDRLLLAFENSNKNLVVPIFKGKRGNPVIVGKKYFEELRNLKGDKGARGIINREPQDIEWVDVEDASILTDIDDFNSLNKYSLSLKNLITDDRQLITFVGAGGKTSSMFLLAGMLKKMGKRVLVTTTTKIYYPEKWQYDKIVTNDELEENMVSIDGGDLLYVLGSGVNEEKKLLGVSPDKIDSIFRNNLFDFILVEGDGAKKRSIKAPSRHEPVIPALTTKLVGVVGMDALGVEINEDNVHRTDLFCKVTLTVIGQVIDENVLIRLIMSEDGLFKKSPPAAELFLLLNKVNINKHREIVCKIKQYLASQQGMIYVLTRELDI